MDNVERNLENVTTENLSREQRARQSDTFSAKSRVADVQAGEVILTVDNLAQHFRLGHHVLKAVDGISFEVKKGEVFGIVGESGCGKTTTGRSIIKLYDATAGSVTLKGQRVVAGSGHYRQAIKDAKRPPDLLEIIDENNLTIKRLTKKQKALRLQQKTAGQNEIAGLQKQIDEYEEQKTTAKQNIAAAKLQIKNITPERKEAIEQNKEKIKEARFDHKKCDKLYQKAQVEKVTQHFQSLLENAHGEELEALQKEYKAALRVAKKERLITQIQMIFQDPISSLNPRMTVFDIISEGLKIKGIRDKEVLKQRVFEVLDLVGLVSDHANRYPHEFSGGQRQRIGIARAIIMNPEVLIADEPVSALDVSIQAQVINLLNELRKKIGLTILFIAHDLSIVKYFSDRVAVMHYGKIVELASKDQLFANPLHPYTKSLLSAIPTPDPLYERQRKRVQYNPLAEHDYSIQKPSLREVQPNHFVMCNDAEYEAIQKVLGK